MPFFYESGTDAVTTSRRSTNCDQDFARPPADDAQLHSHIRMVSLIQSSHALLHELREDDQRNYDGSSLSSRDEESTGSVFCADDSSCNEFPREINIVTFMTDGSESVCCHSSAAASTTSETEQSDDAFGKMSIPTKEAAGKQTSRLKDRLKGLRGIFQRTNDVLNESQETALITCQSVNTFNERLEI